MRSYRLRALAAVLLCGCGPRSSSPHVEYIPVGGSANRPFSAAVRVGDLLILSGQLGTDSTGTLVPGGIAPETRQALENIRRVLQANGSSLDRVVKCTVMLADMQEWGAMNEVYITFFPKHLPARSAFGASGLARNGRVEVECWATVEVAAR
jgi:2-iminobutanoate/2-iminopropanoate deaminase